MTTYFDVPASARGPEEDEWGPEEDGADRRVHRIGRAGPDAPEKTFPSLGCVGYAGAPGPRARTVRFRGEEYETFRCADFNATPRLGLSSQSGI